MGRSFHLEEGIEIRGARIGKDRRLLVLYEVFLEELTVKQMIDVRMLYRETADED
ncbi:hypothetical protein BH11ARM2_BH11ARM2_04390 [soil metagenome]